MMGGEVTIVAVGSAVGSLNSEWRTSEAGAPRVNGEKRWEGWYPDPQAPDRLRWFNAQEWTEHTRALDPVGSEAAVAGGPAVPRPSRPMFRAVNPPVADAPASDHEGPIVGSPRSGGSWWRRRRQR